MIRHSESHLNLSSITQQLMELTLQHHQLLNKLPLTLQQLQQQQLQLFNRPTNRLQHRQMLINEQRPTTTFLPVIFLLGPSHHQQQQQHPYPFSRSNNNNNNSNTCITPSNKQPILQRVSRISTKPNLSSRPLTSEVTFRETFIIENWTSEAGLQKRL